MQVVCTQCVLFHYACFNGVSVSEFLCVYQLVRSSLVCVSVFHAVLCCAVLWCSIGLKTVIEAASGNLAASLAALVSSKMNTGAQQKVRRQGCDG